MYLLNVFELVAIGDEFVMRCVQHCMDGYDKLKTLFIIIKHFLVTIELQKLKQPLAKLFLPFYYIKLLIIILLLLNY